MHLGRIGAQRLLAGEQEITREAVLHGDDVTDLAQLFNAFEQDHVHAGSSLLNDVRKQPDMTGALDRLGEFALLLGRNGGDAAGDDLAPLGHEALQQTDILIVDPGSKIGRAHV